MAEPYIIEFPRFGTDDNGYLTPFENLPFPIAHVYTIGSVPEGESRGNHAKKENSQVIVALKGKAVFSLEAPQGQKYDFILDSTNLGLFIPAGYWRSVKLYDEGILIVMHSAKYSAEDYIHDYDEFKKMNNR